LLFHFLLSSLRGERRLAGWSALGLALVACSAGGAPPVGGSVEYLGVEGGAPDFDLLVLEADDTIAPLADGASVPMIQPPQGGRVVFVGVRATNVDGHGLQLTGALRDLATQEVRVDSRTVNLVDTHDGYGASAAPGASAAAAIASFANVAVCPNQWSSTNLYGNVYGLEVTIQDREGRTVTKKIKVTPECGEPDNLAECLCICQAGYILGQSCVDAGTN
jgi:hypothetical protein